MGFWWCCCGPTIETCNSSLWPSTITVTTDGHTVVLNKDLLLGIWKADVTVTGVSAKDAACADASTITVRLELDCVSGSPRLDQIFRLVTGATCAGGSGPPCYYGSVYPSANLATVRLAVTSFINSPFGLTGTWPTAIPDTGPGSYGTPSWMCPAPPIQGSATAS